MKHIFLNLAAITLVATASSQTPNPPTALPTVEQVLEKFVAAIGGRSTYEKLTSRVAKGQWQNITRGTQYPIEIYSKAPNLRVEVLEIPENLGPTARGYDGVRGWSSNLTETGLRILEGAELGIMQRESDFYRLIKLERLYKRLSITGVERIEGREAYCVEAVPEVGNTEKFYFDVETSLLTRRDITYGRSPVQQYFDDYRIVDGIKLPFVLRSEGAVNVITRLTDVRHNTPIDDRIFKIPGVK